MSISIDEISEFIEEKELNAISEEILERFRDLRRKNYAEYLSDAKIYAFRTLKFMVTRYKNGKMSSTH